MKGQTMKVEDALTIISEVITFYFDIRGKAENKEELNWRKKVETAENLINQKLKRKGK
jgi:hypothetical protein